MTIVTRFLLVLLGLTISTGLVTAIAGISPVQAKFIDDRFTALRKPGTEMGAVGMVLRLDPEGEVIGSGFLVSPCHVLTAAHVLSGKNGIQKNQVVFFFAGTGDTGPAFLKANFFSTISPARPVVWGESKSFNSGSTAEREEARAKAGWYDWALLKLDRCLGDEGFGYLNLLPISTGDFVRQGGSYAVQSVGLPADHDNKALTVDPTCTIFGQVDYTGWQHDCTTMPGNSGGPIMAAKPQNGEKWPRVLGIHIVNITNGKEGEASPNPVDPDAPDYFGELATAVPVSAFLPKIAPYLRDDAVIKAYLAEHGEDGDAAGKEGDRGYDVKQPKAAIDDLTVALQHQPGEPSLLTRRGLWLQTAEDRDAALIDFSAALKADPTFAPALYARAILRASRDDKRLKDAEAARADLDSLIKRFPGNIDLRIIRGSMLSGIYDYRAALIDFDAVLKNDPDNLSALLSRANARMELGQVNGAGDDYDHAVVTSPDRAAAYIERASYRSRKRDTAGAHADLVKALEIEPENPTALGARAIVFLDEGNISSALADIEHTIRLDSDSGGHVALRGTIKQMKGDFSGAVDDYRAAAALDPTEPFDSLMLFLALAQDGRKDAGEAELKHLLQRWPQDEWPAPLARHLIGQIDEKALRRRALIGNETLQAYQDFDFHFYLGAFAMISGDKTTAKTYLQHVVDSKMSQFLEYTLARAFLENLGGPAYLGAK